MKARLALAPIVLAALAGCASASPRPETNHRPPSARPDAFARLGQAVRVGPWQVSPVAVLEDSRCPINARCVRAGEIRVRVAVRYHGRSENHELTLERSASLANGTLVMDSAEPGRVAGKETKAQDYRFHFRFAGPVIT